jgi:hypothetical protein
MKAQFPNNIEETPSPLISLLFRKRVCAECDSRTKRIHTLCANVNGITGGIQSYHWMLRDAFLAMSAIQKIISNYPEYLSRFLLLGNFSQQSLNSLFHHYRSSRWQPVSSACWKLEFTHISFSFVVLCQTVPLAWKHKRADPRADVAYHLPYWPWCLCSTYIIVLYIATVMKKSC